MSAPRLIKSTDVSQLLFSPTGGSEANTLADWLAGLGRSTVPAIKAQWYDIDNMHPNIWRLRDRTFIGDAVNMLDTSANATQNTYIPNGFGGPNWLLRDATLVVGSDRSAIGGAFYTQSANSIRAPIALGAAALHNVSGTGTAWAQYLEVDHQPGTPVGSFSYAIEIDARNSTARNDSGDPYGTGYGTNGIWLAAGGGPSYGLNSIVATAATSTSSSVISVASVPSWIAAGQTVKNISNQLIGLVASTGTGTITLVSNAAVAVALNDTLNIQFPPNTGLVFVANLTSWNVGIDFADGSLTKDTNGNSKAISMGQGATLTWYASAGVVGSQIRGSTSSASSSIRQLFSNNQVEWDATNGTAILTLQHVTTGVNGMLFNDSVTTANPILRPVGSDTNIGLDINSKGTGRINVSALNMRQGVGTTLAPTSNGDISIEFTGNTTVTVKGKGSDGTVRSTTLTLA